MKKLIEFIIKRRNPEFKFDDAVSISILLSLFTSKSISLIRSLKLLFWGKFFPFLYLGQNVKFFNIRNIKIGKWVQLGDYTFLSALGKGKLKIGNNVSIGSFSRVIISTSFNNIGSHIYIGNNVGMGDYAHLGGAGRFEIGNYCI